MVIPNHPEPRSKHPGSFRGSLMLVGFVVKFEAGDHNII